MKRRTKDIYRWCRLLAPIVEANGGTVTNKDNRAQLLQDWLDAVGGPCINYYSLLSSAFDVGVFDSSVTIDETETVSLRLGGLDDSSATQSLLGSSGEATVKYRGSDGRLRVEYDDNSSSTVNETAINDGGDYFIIIRNNVTSVEFSTYSIASDGELTLVSQLTGVGAPSVASFECYAARRPSDSIVSMSIGVVYGITLGGYSSWTLQSSSNTEFNGDDLISGNNITIVNGPSPITSDDTILTPQAVNL